MGDMIYLAAGHATFWIISFGLVYSFINRQHNLERELRMLEQMIESEGEFDES